MRQEIFCILLIITAQLFIPTNTFFPSDEIINKSETKNQSILLNSVVELSNLYHTDFFLENNVRPFDLIEDKTGLIWFSMVNDSNLRTLNPNTTEIKTYQLQPGITPLLIKKAENGLIWFSDHNLAQNNDTDHIGSFNVTSNKLSIYPINQNVAPFDLYIKNETVWFTEWWGDKLGKLNTSTENIEEIDIKCESSNCGPIGLNFDSSGKLWYTDSLAGSFVSYDTNNSKFEIFKLPNNFVSPVDLAIDSKGLIWSGSHGGDKLLSFNPLNNEIITYYTPRPSPDEYPVSGINDIEFDSKNDVWFSEHFVNRIGRFHRDSQTIQEFFIPRDNPLIQWIHAGKDDKIWYAEDNNGVIGYIDAKKAPMLILSTDDEIIQIKQRQSQKIQFSVEYQDGIFDKVNIHSFGELKGVLGVNFHESDDLELSKGNSANIDLEISIDENAWTGIYIIIIGILGDSFSASKQITIEIIDNPDDKLDVYLFYIVGIGIGAGIGVLVYVVLWKKTDRGLSNQID